MAYSERLVLDLVGLIYESASELSVWPRFLERYSDAVRCTSTLLLLYDTDQRVGNVEAAARFDPVDLRRYNEYYVAVDPWGTRAQRRIVAGAVLRGESLCPSRVLERSEFYADFLRPMDVFHESCGIVALEGSAASVIASLRPRRRGPFREEELALLKLLMPHLQRALALHRRLGSLQFSAQSALAVLDRLPHGVVLLSATARVLLINRSAKAILDQADGLTVRQQELHSSSWDSNKRLQALMHGAAATSSGCALHSGGALSIVRPSGRKSLRILVSPIHRELFASDLTAPAAIVFIVDPEGRFDTPIDMLAELFALSRAEARLGALLLQDRSLCESARELGVSLNTVRTQLKRLFEKTGTNRQRALIRALLLSPAHLTAWSQMPAGERQNLSDAVRIPGARARPTAGARQRGH